MISVRCSRAVMLDPPFWWASYHTRGGDFVEKMRREK